MEPEAQETTTVHLTRADPISEAVDHIEPS